MSRGLCRLIAVPVDPLDAARPLERVQPLHARKLLHATATYWRPMQEHATIDHHAAMPRSCGDAQDQQVAFARIIHAHPAVAQSGRNRCGHAVTVVRARIGVKIVRQHQPELGLQDGTRAAPAIVGIGSTPPIEIRNADPFGIAFRNDHRKRPALLDGK